MPVTCCAFGCKNSSHKGYTMVGFPLDNQELLKKWIVAFGRKGWCPRKNHRLCEVHFDESKIMAYGTRKYIQEGAVPSKFCLCEELSRLLKARDPQHIGSIMKAQLRRRRTPKNWSWNEHSYSNQDQTRLRKPSSLQYEDHSYASPGSTEKRQDLLSPLLEPLGSVNFNVSNIKKSEEDSEHFYNSKENAVSLDEEYSNSVPLTIYLGKRTQAFKSFKHCDNCPTKKAPLSAKEILSRMKYFPCIPRRRPL